MRTWILVLATLATVLPLPARAADAGRCRPRECEPTVPLVRALRHARFVAIGTLVDGQLEIDRRWRARRGDPWRVRVLFDAYRCCDLHRDALEGSRWLVVSRNYPFKAIATDHSRLLRELTDDEAVWTRRVVDALGPGEAYPTAWAR